MTETSRALSTERRYRARGLSLFMAWRRANPPESPLSPTAFVAWMLGRAPRMRSATFRQYKAAMLLAMPNLFPSTSDLDLALERLRRAEHRSVGALPRRTSARKLKYVSEGDWLSLAAYLRAKGDGYGDDAPGSGVTSALVEAWCRVTLLCGLRPTEWFNASVEMYGDGARVIVGNAKATHGRAHGQTRTLLFEALDDKEIWALRLVHGWATAWAAAGRASELQKLVADRLYRAARQALGRRDAYPSLYTFRHQAIANWKTEHGTVEVAALCGHAVIETATKHYAGRSRAWRGRRPSLARPSPENVQAVLTARAGGPAHNDVSFHMSGR